MTDTATVFGPQGLLATKFAGYETRDGQSKMARAVEKALADRKHLAVEAPCGIGKSFSYLAPAIEHAVRTNTRVVICTANIALQEQLVTKDLPRMKEILPIPFRYELIKGIGNYLCLDRYHDARQELAGFGADLANEGDWNRLLDWGMTTKSGDPADLPFLPPDGLWNRINGVSELCNGAQCRFFDDCHAMNARRRLMDANVIVTNYHLYFAHLAVKIVAERDVILPPHQAVICDEAHEMADIARDFFGRRFSVWSVNMLTKGAHLLGLRSIAERLRTESRSFFEQVRSYHHGPRYKVRLREGKFADPTELESAVRDYQKMLKDLGRSSKDEAENDKVAKFLGAANHYLETLEAFLKLDDPNQVAWIDEEPSHRGGDATIRLTSRLIDVSAMLKEHLFGTIPSVILTSATLSCGKLDGEPNFTFLKRETGSEEAKELSVASPFDFREQARLIVPSMTAAPNDPEFAPEMSKSINRIITELGGRTLALFTSYKNMNLCADAAKSTGVEILRQGEKPRSQLLERFREDKGTALFATSSFWQGIDVPGEALSCLIIDKIPFLTPEDPLVDALQERDRETFMRYTLPKAIISLRQGIGRLIRTKTDRGVIVIFDNRVFTARYGREILASLPEVRIHRDLAAVSTFFGKRA